MPIHRAQLHLQLQGVARRSLLVVAVRLGDSGGVEVLSVQCVEGDVVVVLRICWQDFMRGPGLSTRLWRERVVRCVPLPSSPRVVVDFP